MIRITNKWHKLIENDDEQKKESNNMLSPQPPSSTSLSKSPVKSKLYDYQHKSPRTKAILSKSSDSKKSMPLFADTIDPLKLYVPFTIGDSGNLISLGMKVGGEIEALQSSNSEDTMSELSYLEFSHFAAEAHYHTLVAV